MNLEEIQEKLTTMMSMILSNTKNIERNIKSVKNNTEKIEILKLDDQIKFGEIKANYSKIIEKNTENSLKTLGDMNRVKFEKFMKDFEELSKSNFNIYRENFERENERKITELGGLVEEKVIGAIEKSLEEKMDTMSETHEKTIKLFKIELDKKFIEKSNEFHHTIIEENKNHLINTEKEIQKYLKKAKKNIDELLLENMENLKEKLQIEIRKDLFQKIEGDKLEELGKKIIETAILSREEAFEECTQDQIRKIENYTRNFSIAHKKYIKELKNIVRAKKDWEINGRYLYDQIVRKEGDIRMMCNEVNKAQEYVQMNIHSLEKNFLRYDHNKLKIFFQNNNHEKLNEILENFSTLEYFKDSIQKSFESVKEDFRDFKNESNIKYEILNHETEKNTYVSKWVYQNIYLRNVSGLKEYEFPDLNKKYGDGDVDITEDKN